jgi:regulator of replication initiation timing
MEDKEFNKQVEKFIDSIMNLTVDDATKNRLLDQANKVRAQREHTQEAVNQVKESMGSLRVHIQYLMFDLEATRRENQQLRRQLGEQDDES